MINKIKTNLELIKQNKPLILCLVNHVTMNTVANCLLSIGAAPIMSESLDEIEELVKISHAVYINIGTLNADFMDRVRLACKIAKHYNKPVILDPVGAGASKIRTDATNELLPFVDIIRGNASEIMAAADACQKTLGVESVHQVSDAIYAARSIAKQHNIIVMISGKDDFVTDGINEMEFSFGSALMPLVTGMGCRLTAVIAAFRSLNPNAYEATYLAGIYFSITGQIAEDIAKTPAAFDIVFTENLFQPNWNKMKEL